MTYSKVFSRDFSLANIEVWYRAESLNSKGWTEKKQPFQPYILFEKVDNFVNVYYSDEGFAWTKRELLEKVKEPGFLLRLKKEVLSKMKPINEACEKKLALNHSKLVLFLDHFEKAYPWLEAMWFLCEIIESLKGIDVAPLERLRKATEKIAPNTEQVIRKSIMKCFPEYKSLAHVISGEEIRTKKIPLLEELKKRDKGYVYADNRLFTGVKKEYVAQKYSMTFNEEKSGSGEVKGTSVYPGVVSGKVKIVMSYRETSKVNNGDILVASMTMTDVMPAIKKAAAIVTDEGGVLCHAAIIARELKKPCIIGTKNATKVFKDGDLVEVDAEKGVVRKIK